MSDLSATSVRGGLYVGIVVHGPVPDPGHGRPLGHEFGCGHQGWLAHERQVVRGGRGGEGGGRPATQAAGSCPRTSPPADTPSPTAAPSIAPGTRYQRLP